jgi:zinc transport system ATP-binding protein
MNGGDGVVAVRGAVAVLGERAVLHGVDLTVPAGQVVALLGPNGSGKSTLVRTAIGLLPLASGEVRLFGTPLGRFRDWGRVGYVPQRTTAASGVPATVREVVASGRLARRRPFLPATASDREAVDNAIELVGLNDRADESVASLSGGQQQRVLIARAAATDPDLLVLDEPNAGVDLPSQEAFARALRTFVASGRSVLVVLHELGPLERLIDRAVVLSNGRVVHDGPLPVPAGVAGDWQHHHPDRPQAAEEGLFG